MDGPLEPEGEAPQLIRTDGATEPPLSLDDCDALDSGLQATQPTSINSPPTTSFLILGDEDASLLPCLAKKFSKWDITIATHLSAEGIKDCFPSAFDNFCEAPFVDRKLGVSAYRLADALDPSSFDQIFCLLPGIAFKRVGLPGTATKEVTEAGEHGESKAAGSEGGGGDEGAGKAEASGADDEMGAEQVTDPRSPLFSLRLSLFLFHLVRHVKVVCKAGGLLHILWPAQSSEKDTPFKYPPMQGVGTFCHLTRVDDDPRQGVPPIKLDWEDGSTLGYTPIVLGEKMDVVPEWLKRANVYSFRVGKGPIPVPEVVALSLPPNIGGLTITGLDEARRDLMATLKRTRGAGGADEEATHDKPIAEAMAESASLDPLVIGEGSQLAAEEEHHAPTAADREHLLGDALRELLHIKRECRKAKREWAIRREEGLRPVGAPSAVPAPPDTTGGVPETETGKAPEKAEDDATKPKADDDVFADTAEAAAPGEPPVAKEDEKESEREEEKEACGPGEECSVSKSTHEPTLAMAAKSPVIMEPHPMVPLDEEWNVLRLPKVLYDISKVVLPHVNLLFRFYFDEATKGKGLNMLDPRFDRNPPYDLLKAFKDLDITRPSSHQQHKSPYTRSRLVGIGAYDDQDMAFRGGGQGRMRSRGWRPYRGGYRGRFRGRFRGRGRGGWGYDEWDMWDGYDDMMYWDGMYHGGGPPPAWGQYPRGGRGRGSFGAGGGDGFFDGGWFRMGRGGPPRWDWAEGGQQDFGWPPYGGDGLFGDDGMTDYSFGGYHGMADFGPPRGRGYGSFSGRTGPPSLADTDLSTEPPFRGRGRGRGSRRAGPPSLPRMIKNKQGEDIYVVQVGGTTYFENPSEPTPSGSGPDGTQPRPPPFTRPPNRPPSPIRGPPPPRFGGMGMESGFGPASPAGMARGMAPPSGMGRGVGQGMRPPRSTSPVGYTPFGTRGPGGVGFPGPDGGGTTMYGAPVGPLPSPRYPTPHPPPPSAPPMVTPPTHPLSVVGVGSGGMSPAGGLFGSHHGWRGPSGMGMGMGAQGRGPTILGQPYAPAGTDFNRSSPSSRGLVPSYGGGGMGLGMPQPGPASHGISPVGSALQQSWARDTDRLFG
ncbi:unnamed protein product [Vitrella brassicaformis CCMP3155]|uniref:Uncharacterized protein n=3 Tax=Vitrella brassicaformis TaxID=1169539 RepID=A0A0G4GDW1_VITBC|nr:unnamed protein product [Vitrella brassicaformis CCMP3155]|eukprot:CEM27515.1 unnamed protein product [Vitrella brassicaformis CCMP3155]